MNQQRTTIRASRAWRFFLIVLVSIAYDPSTPAAPPSPEAFKDRSCSDMACHGGLTKRKTLHAPLEGDACDTCHEQENPTIHAFKYPYQGNELCTDCHDEFEGKHIHEAVASGDCITCHNPHSSDTAALLTSDSVGDLCNECHEEVTDDFEFLHGPVAAGDCTVCHQPHASEHGALLTTAGNDLCFECHDDVEDDLADATSKHSPVEDSCTACHSPHGGKHKMMLSQPSPALCLDCHDDIADRVDEATYKHSAVTTGNGCTNCHVPHASKYASLMRDTNVKTCLSCHGKEIKSGSRVFASIGEQLKNNTHLHGPVQDGECTACHTPHGGEHARLLTEAFPTTFYSPFAEDNYAICFSCHDVEAFEEAQVEDETAFRNGTQNLHFLHVNKPKKGRTCTACHAVHASSSRGHLAKSTIFGKWTLPIRFAPTETGGSCQPGCHKPYRYDRDKHVVNLPKAAVTENETD